MSSTMLAILYAVHLLAAVIWIGGLVLLFLVVIPGARRVLGNLQAAETHGQKAAQALLTELERRFTPLANLSLVMLVATGMLQMSVDENYDGFLQFSNTWAWAMLFKHVTIVGMALIAAYVALVLEPERRRLQTLAVANRPDEESNQRLARRRVRQSPAQPAGRLGEVRSTREGVWPGDASDHPRPPRPRHRAHPRQERRAQGHRGDDGSRRGLQPRQSGRSPRFRKICDQNRYYRKLVLTVLRYYL